MHIADRHKSGGRVARPAEKNGVQSFFQRFAASDHLSWYLHVSGCDGFMRRPYFIDERRDAVSNLVLVIEVLSGSTKNYDRDQKFKNYRTIPSLSEYLMIAQDEIRMEHYAKQPDGRWMLAEYQDSNNHVPLMSIGVEILLSDVYEKVEFESR